MGIVQLCNVGTLVEGQSCHDTVCCCVRGGIVQLCNVGTLVEGQSCDDIVCCCDCVRGRYCSAV